MKDPSNYIYATITFVGFAVIIYFSKYLYLFISL